MGILKILGVVAMGVLACAGIIIVSCVVGQAEQTEELEHPERVKLDGRD